MKRGYDKNISPLNRTTWSNTLFEYFNISYQKNHYIFIVKHIYVFHIHTDPAELGQMKLGHNYFTIQYQSSPDQTKWQETNEGWNDFY